MDERPEAAPVPHHQQFGGSKQSGVAERKHHAEAGDRQQQSEEARKPSGAEAPCLDRSFQVARQ
jgi:hypothetical protein